MTVERISAHGWIFVVVDLGQGYAPESFAFRPHQLDLVVAFEEWIVATTALITGGRVRLERVKGVPL